MARVHPEQLYLSALLRSGDVAHPLKSGINDEHFDAFKAEWEWVTRYMKKHGKTPSKMSFKSKFPETTVYAVDDIDHFADELHEACNRRNVVDMLTKSADLVMKGSLADAISLLNAGAKRVATSMNAPTIRETSVIADFDHVFDTVSAKVERFRKYGKAGVPTGIPTLDIATGGAQPGELWVVAARLGAGKSWMLMRMAKEAVVTGNDALYNALEQSRAVVGLRVQNLMSSAWSSASLNRGEVKDLAAYHDFLADLKTKIKGALVVSDRPRITPEYLASQIERNRPAIVFVDYLTLMRTNRSGAAKDWLNVGELSAELKAIAEEYQIPVITAAQINRAGAGTRETPGTEHLSYADAVGQDADAVVTMTRVSQHLLRCKFAKYRNGEDGQKFAVQFDPGKGVVEEVSGDRANELIEIDASEDDSE